MRFGPSYCEQVRLADGLRVWLGPVRPDDKRRLLEGLSRLSPGSSYFRFMGARRSLSERDLHYLTEIDGIDHFAIGAVLVQPDGSEEGIGVARFIRLPGEPAVAEPAITVIDDYQGKGLGGLLLRRLVRAARERGVHRFRCQFLADNERGAFRPGLCWKALTRVQA
jgi:GNAT superfamily N-acetyltransferase